MLNQSTAALSKLASLFWYIARYLITGMLLGAVLGGSAQNGGDPDAGMPPVPDKLVEEVWQKAGRTSESLLLESVQYLRRIEASEEKLRNKLAKKDSAKVAALFGDVADRYASALFFRTQFAIFNPMNDHVTKIDLSDNPKASEALKAFQAEKEAKLRALEKEAEEYAAKLKKPKAV